MVVSVSKSVSKKFTKKSQRGLSLVQALFVLVLGGIALAAALNQFQSGERQTQVQKLIGDVSEIVGGSKANYGQYNFTGLSTAIAIGSAVIPARLATSATTAAADWGGAITLVDNSGTTPATALLTFANVPTALCANLVNGTHVIVRGVSVGGAVVKALDGQPNIATLNTQCTSAAAVNVTWTVGRS